MSQVNSAPNSPSLHEEGPLVLNLGRVTPFKAIIQIAENKLIPLGIVLGPHPLLCSQERPISVVAATVKEAFSQALVGTGYSASIEGNAYVITAPDATQDETKLLNFRFETFTSTNGSMNYAGALLAGYIKTSIGGARGFAIDSLLGPSSKTFTIKMQSATTMEIADRIVSQVGKGLWVMRPRVDTLAAPEAQTPIEIFSYSEDAQSLGTLTCGADVNASK